ncbi:COQ9 family protein [Rhodalgimonas zhirmunskyi]|uniref:COQ9 family protein n=1 Tax=Rhodalgimonas zhirmunskyi TaxID=2964767 RepID=A0AAJ1UAY1_9RHOB|nr:COQ9 family protein [Rhodoalgimonas zhirmunskyi]MDQ2094483.1 COQ9 family protein [Rhodoalgimonas zhirmunskyi]
MTETLENLLDAALLHVPFDGWSETTFRAAVEDAGIDMTLARGICPRGAVDLAVAYHKRGDAKMLARLEQAELDDMRFRDRIAFAVRARLEAVEDRELVRRGMTLFALPQHGAEGAKLVWETCDAIWTALGDESRDANWYTKRATLGAVYSSTLLFWLGDDSPGHEETWEFLDRRIDGVMQFEKVKAGLRKVPGLGKFMEGATAMIRAPKGAADMPGSWGNK